MVTLTNEDIKAVADEVVRQMRPMLGLEGNQVEYVGPERVSGRRSAQISAQAQMFVSQFKEKQRANDH